MAEKPQRYFDYSKVQKAVSSNGLQTPDKKEVRRVSDYDYFINVKSKRRTPSAMREIMKIIRDMPYTIPFAGGIPNGTMFPFQKLAIDLKDGTNYTIEDKDLESAFQYMPTSGYPPLIKQLQRLQDLTHGEQCWGADDGAQAVIVSAGAQEALSAVFEVFLVEGEPVIIPIPLYTGAADALRAIAPKYVGIEQDKDGVDPEKLREALEEIVRQKGVLPKLMYINPIGCNPTGANLSLDRKRELYSLACKYNFVILEDDPYYFLHFEKETVASFLSMDVEGRVLRLDTFSKVLGAGLRLGYVTGPVPLLRRLEWFIQLANIHSSALSQVLVSRLLDHWSYERLHEHIAEVKAFYLERRDLMLDACERYLKGLAEWNVPKGGMFLWVRVPMLEDTWDLAVDKCVRKCLLVVPGHPFTGEMVPSSYNYIRLSFSLATPQQVDEGIKLLAELIQEEVNNRKP